ncbi:MAG: recombinase family protein, partial [Coleofasciculus sp. C2-GNP5-27]
MNLPNLDEVKQSLIRQMTEKKAVLDQLNHLTATGVLDHETAQLRAYKLRTEQSQLQAQLDSLPPVNLGAIAQTVSIPQFWSDLSESERRFYFREFIRQVQLIRQGQQWRLQLVFIF